MTSLEREPKLPCCEPTRLAKHVNALTSTSLPRNFGNIGALNEASDYIYSSLQTLGLVPAFQSFSASGKTYRNVVVRLTGQLEDRIVIGAHYDVAGDGPGADDNASGVAGVLELARLLKDASLRKTVELVAYCLEEPPFFATSEMGSAIHARSLRDAGTQVSLMLSLEMIGYFNEQPDSQDFPIEQLRDIYPNRGNFIAVAGDVPSARVTEQVKTIMRRYSRIGVESISAPRELPGISFSDHFSYWEQGFPAAMITDTAFFRNPNYHYDTDTPDTLDYKKMAEVVNAVRGVALEY